MRKLRKKNLFCFVFLSAIFSSSYAYENVSQKKNCEDFFAKIERNKVKKVILSDAENIKNSERSDICTKAKPKDAKASGYWEFIGGVDYIYSNDTIDSNTQDIHSTGLKFDLLYKQLKLSNSVSFDFSIGAKDASDITLDDQDILTSSLMFYLNPNKQAYNELLPEEGNTYGLILNYSDFDVDDESIENYSADVKLINTIWQHNEYNERTDTHVSLVGGVKYTDSDRGYEDGVDVYFDAQLRKFNPNYGNNEKWKPSEIERVFPRLYVSKHSGEKDDFKSPLATSFQGSVRGAWSLRKFSKVFPKKLYLNLQLTAGIDYIDNFQGGSEALTSRFIMPVLFISWNNDTVSEGGGGGGWGGGRWYRP